MICRDQAGYEIELEDNATAALTVWDIQRFHRYENSGKIAEEINIKIEDYGSEFIKATLANTENEPYNIFIGVMNGNLLFNLYDKWGTRLLERNVRAYLQARGRKSVNSEIRKTIREEPEMFMAYNNGLTITCNHLDFDLMGDKGESVIKSMGTFRLLMEDKQSRPFGMQRTFIKNLKFQKLMSKLKLLISRTRKILKRSPIR